MDERRIRELVDELDARVPREGATVRLEPQEERHGEQRAVANRAGALRLGIALLRAALKAMDEDAAGRRAVARVETDGWLDPDSDVSVGAVELRDLLGRPATPAHRAAERAGMAACAVLALAFLVVFGIGLATVIGWLR